MSRQHIRTVVSGKGSRGQVEVDSAGRFPCLDGRLASTGLSTGSRHSLNPRALVIISSVASVGLPSVMTAIIFRQVPGESLSSLQVSSLHGAECFRSAPPRYAADCEDSRTDRRI